MDIQNLISDIMAIRAEVFMAISTLFLLVYGVCLKTRAIQQTAIIAVTILFITGIMIAQQDNVVSADGLFGGMLVLDSFGVFMKMLILLGGVAAILMGVRDLAGHVIGRFEYNILILLATLGMMIMVSANNMLTLYMGLELQSLSLYLLAAFNRNSLQSSEAGLKYFILGALSSGLLLFGISLVYGFTGSTSYAVIADNLAVFTTTPLAIIVGMVFILIGLAFKISAVPFHMWTPDVYEGAPASVTAFFATAPKVAALALIIRLLMEPFGTVSGDWSQIIYALSLLSMLVGAFAGLVQKNMYRLLAYSSIGHMGYILLGILAGTEQGVTASLIYIAIYMVMTAGTFALILSVRANNIALRETSDFAGLSTQSPKTAYGLTIFLFSMSGIPPMAGFFGKLFVFQAALAQDYVVLAIIGVLTSVVAAYYYLSIIKTMFFDKATIVKDRDVVNSHLLNSVAYIALVFTAFYIVFPNWLVAQATIAAQSLLN